ncbi:arginine deiminase-related protein [Balneatrix alpica]|uniref:arginine deiminase-related protein n=1 Tax=Balneatrix alpica TaxID=75684 RepID=UPI0027394BF5|nr:arginine deiminase-related protein [Balneatrix alpica]
MSSPLASRPLYVDPQHPWQAPLLHPQLAEAVVMVRPVDFVFNEQTGVDNEFQQRLDLAPTEITRRALAEFDAMVERLQHAGIEVLVLDGHADPNPTPDAVFPNNWFTTSAEGVVHVYPMFTENRRQERRVQELLPLLLQHGFQVNELSWVGHPLEQEQILEGTGVMIFDHPRKRVFAALSQRCQRAQLHNYARMRGLQEVIAFDTRSSQGKPIYHTNVMMSLGRELAIICLEAVVPEQRQQVQNALAEQHQIVELSMAQMEQHFCANVLQMQSRQGVPYWVMSASAWQGFSPAQQRMLERYGEPLINPIPTLEQVGGGSCRCMLAEVFLPRQG